VDKIPSPEKEPKKEGGIPRSAAELPEEEAPELEPALISFSRYNPKECQLDGLEKEFAKCVLRAFRDIGTTTHSMEDIGRVGREVKIVARDGTYANLFKHLDDITDLEINEIILDYRRGDESQNDGRVFFFMVGGKFYFIAVRQSHYDTNHSKRKGNGTRLRYF
jgi:hypothetical protein